MPPKQGGYPPIKTPKSTESPDGVHQKTSATLPQGANKKN